MASCGDRVWCFQALWSCRSPQVFLHLWMQKLSKPSTLVSLWRLHYIGIINEIIGHWALVHTPTPLPFSAARRRALKCQPFKHMVGSLGNQQPPPPHPAPPWPEVLSKHPLVNITKDSSVTLFTQETSRVFRTLCRNKDYMLYIYNIKPQYHMCLIFHGKCEISSGRTNANASMVDRMKHMGMEFQMLPWNS